MTLYQLLQCKWLYLPFTNYKGWSFTNYKGWSFTDHIGIDHPLPTPGIGARKFRTKAPECGDRSVWTDTPADKQRRAEVGWSVHVLVVLVVDVWSGGVGWWWWWRRRRRRRKKKWWWLDGGVVCGGIVMTVSLSGDQDGKELWPEGGEEEEEEEGEGGWGYVCIHSR